MKPCPRCSGTRLKVEAVYQAIDHIAVRPDGTHELLDTRFDNGEWEDTGVVTCEGCGHTAVYFIWNLDPAREIKVSFDPGSEIRTAYQAINPETGEIREFSEEAYKRLWNAMHEDETGAL